MQKRVLSSLLTLYLSAQLSMQPLFCQQKVQQTPQQNVAKITAAGDTAICKIHQRSINETHDWMIDILKEVEAKEGLEAAINYPFKNVSGYFKDRIGFVNLEGSYVDADPAEKRASKTFAIFLPKQYLDSLKLFKMVSLANNHAMDNKNQGIYNTTFELKKRGIEYVGAGKNMARARTGKIIEQNGIKIGFLAYNAVGPDYFYAEKNNPGVAGSKDSATLEQCLAEDISKLKKQSNAVVVSFHWGKEASHTVNEKQIALAHAAIDDGASLILGHHPHVLQEAEIYKDKLIVYSLANFSFGGVYTKDNGYSVILQAEIDKQGKLVHYKFIPIRVNPRITKYQPTVLNKADGKHVFDVLKLPLESPEKK